MREGGGGAQMHDKVTFHSELSGICVHVVCLVERATLLSLYVLAFHI